MENEENNALLALADVLGGSRYTTEEARRLAKGAYENFESMQAGINEQEEDYYARLDRSADEARNILSNARSYVENRRYNNGRKPWLEIAAALGKPTKSGSFGEGMGYVSEALLKDDEGRQKFEDTRQSSLTDIDQQLAAVDRTLAEGRLAALQKKRDTATKGQLETLKILGKEIKGAGSGAAGLSEAEKHVRGALGLAPGDRGYNEAVAARQAELDQMERERSGTDVPEDESEDSLQVRAMDMGIPYQMRDPFAGYSTKNRQKRKETLEANAAKRLDEVRTVRTQADKTIADMENFLSLNKKQRNTGPILGWFTRYLTSEGENMAGISSEQARNLRVPGEGPMSNYDATELKNATVSVLKRPESNERVARAVLAAKKRQLEYSNYLNDYYAAYGHVDGADRAWIEYSEANPIFDKQKPGALEPNKGRINYKQYFRIRNAEIDDPEFARLPLEQKLFLTAEAADEPEQKAEGGRVGMADAGYVDTDEEETEDGKAEQMLKAFLQGGTFNWSDEAIAALGGDVGKERGVLERYHKSDPVESLIAEATGALPTSAAALYGLNRLGKSTGRLGKIAGVASRVVPKSTTGKVMATGALSGAVAGAGGSQDPDQIVPDTLIGAGAGVLLAPIAGLMAKYGVKSWQGLQSLVKQNKISAADMKILEAAMKDDIDIKKELAAVTAQNRRGVPTALGDVPGRNMAGLKTFVLKQPTEGSEELASQIAKRNEGTAERVVDRVNKELAPGRYFDEMDKLKDNLYTQADPLYKKAYKDNPAIDSKAFQKLLEHPDGKKAIDIALNEMRAFDSPNFGTVDALGELKKPSLELMDRIKRALDRKIRSKDDLGENRALRHLREILTTEMDDPKLIKGTAYADARKQYAGDLEVLEALEMGRDQFMRMSKDDFEKAVANMSFAEKDALRTGVAHAIFDAVEGTADTANPVQKIVGNEKMRQKLTALWGSPAQAKKFIEDMETELNLFKQGKKDVATAERSRASEMGKGDAVADSVLAGGAAMVAQGASPLRSPYWMARMGSMLSRAGHRTSKKTVNELAKLMQESNPSNLKGIGDRLGIELQRIRERLQNQMDATLVGGEMAARLSTPAPYGYSSAEEEDGYQRGGPVVRRRFASGGSTTPLPGGPSPKPDPRDMSLLEMVAATANPISTQYTGAPGTTFGTGATRSRRNVGPIDYENYGSGPEVQFFENNRVPDAIYTTTPAGGNGYQDQGMSDSTKGGIMGTLGGLLGGASKLKKGYDILQKAGVIKGIGSGAGATGALAGTGLAGATPVAGATTTTLPVSLGGTGGAAGTGAGAGLGAAGTVAGGLAAVYAGHKIGGAYANNRIRKLASSLLKSKPDDVVAADGPLSWAGTFADEYDNDQLFDADSSMIQHLLNSGAIQRGSGQYTDRGNQFLDARTSFLSQQQDIEAPYVSQYGPDYTKWPKAAQKQWKAEYSALKDAFKSDWGGLSIEDFGYTFNPAYQRGG